MINIDIIKQKVIDEGVVGTCMCVGFWSNGNIHYQPPTNNTDPNHAVAIIGWDDSKQTPAAANGAWLVKNSWGATWGNAGYFWISYYDKHCGQEPQMGAISFQNVEPMQYEKVYYHDYHGWRDELNNCTQAFNAFTSIKYENLEAVSFYTATDSVYYEVLVFDSYSNSILADTLSVKSGFITFTGFHTINLDSIVVLQPSDEFFVYVNLSDGGHPYDRTSVVPVLLGANFATNTIVNSSADYNQSFYKIGSSNWLDIHNLDTSANFCIKALSNPLLPAKAEIPVGDSSVCKGLIQSKYIIPSTPYATTYDWEILPTNAGTLSFQDTSATVVWNPNFLGLAEISVVAQNSNGKGLSSPAISIIMHDNPIVTIGNDTSIELSQSIVFYSNQTFTNYLWSDSTINSSAQYTASTLGLGNHSIWLHATDSNACGSRDSLILNVIPPSAIGEIETFDISIYPNPVLFDFTLEFNFQKETAVNIELIDISGKLILSKKLEVSSGNCSKKIDISNAPKGVYNLILRFDDKTIVRKIIKN